MKTKNKFWDFQSVSDTDAELMLYGDIASERPWWDWEGDTVTQKQFIDELKALGDKSNITVRINSMGGDVFAAHAIYTQLKTHKASITVIIDGIAASAATIVAMAGDVVKMPSNAMMMVHKPLFDLNGMFNADHLLKMVDTLNAVQDSIASAYVSKTKMEREQLNELMNAATWLSAQNAKKYGLTDEILFDVTLEDPQISNDGKFMIFNSVKHDISQISNIPKNMFMKSGFTQASPVQNKQQAKGADEVIIKTINDLRQAYPEFVTQIETEAANSGRKEERQRIQDIERISNTIAPELVNKAKFEQPMDAKELAFQALQNDGRKGQDYLKNLGMDAENSNSDKVTSTNSEEALDNQKPETVKDKFINLASRFDARRRGGANNE